ncbi:MAG: zinc ribbon domain-containing protein [Hydrogenophaga sp.]
MPTADGTAGLMRFCPQCGTRFTDGAKFCFECGTRRQ